jgi:hypothetical protein
MTKRGKGGRTLEPVRYARDEGEALSVAKSRKKARAAARGNYRKRLAERGGVPKAKVTLPAISK